MCSALVFLLIALSYYCFPSGIENPNKNPVRDEKVDFEGLWEHYIQETVTNDRDTEFTMKADECYKYSSCGGLRYPVSSRGVIANVFKLYSTVPKDRFEALLMALKRDKIQVPKYIKQLIANYASGYDADVTAALDQYRDIIVQSPYLLNFYANHIQRCTAMRNLVKYNLGIQAYGSVSSGNESKRYTDIFEDAVGVSSNCYQVLGIHMLTLYGLYANGKLNLKHLLNTKDLENFEYYGEDPRGGYSEEGKKVLTVVKKYRDVAFMVGNILARVPVETEKVWISLNDAMNIDNRVCLRDNYATAHVKFCERVRSKVKNKLDKSIVQEEARVFAKELIAHILTEIESEEVVISQAQKEETHRLVDVPLNELLLH